MIFLLSQLVKTRPHVIEYFDALTEKLDSVQKYKDYKDCISQDWLLLTFFICLHNQLITNKITRSFNMVLLGEISKSSRYLIKIY